MKYFSELGIKLNRRFSGERIRIEKVEGDEIEVLDFEIRQSKLNKKNDPEWDGTRKECLYLQIKHRGEIRVMWGSYKFLIEQIKQVTTEYLPFKARIINEYGYIFK